MEVNIIRKKRSDTDGDKINRVCEVTAISVKRNKVKNVQKLEKEKLRLDSKPVRDKYIPQEADLYRLKRMIYIMSALVLLLLIAVIVLTIIIVVPKVDVVDGGWTNWGIWSTCTVTCGGGTQIRSRTCTNPKPSDLGEYCIGDPIHIQPCNQTGCSLQGGWSNWSNWGSCSITCGVGIQKRFRNCSNPYPLETGEHCFGDTEDARICIGDKCDVHGEWSNWSDWGSCPITCGVGIQKRFRNCSYPHPLRTGEDCFGDTVDARICIGDKCDDGTWTTWNSWDTCNVCNERLLTRSRSCSKEVYGKPCGGDSMQVQMCGECLPLTSCSSKRNYNSSFTNVALRKNVTLSSTFGSYYGYLLVDGNQNTFIHTYNSISPYALVDLADTYLVYSIYIVNRRNCCPERFHNVLIQIGNHPSRLEIAARHRAAIGADCTLDFPTPYRGRYVKIELDVIGPLHIAELEVYSVI